MNSVLSSFCISFIVLAALVAVAIILLKPKKTEKEDTQKVSTENTFPSRKGWKSWLLPFGIALIIAIWTFWGALLFLAVVWVLMQNPKPDSDYAVGEEQKKAAKRIYAWLFWSPIMTVPMFISMVSQLSWNNSSTNERVLAALVPLILHTVLLLGLTSKSAFVYRHTQQGILLMALRAAMAALAVNVGRYPDDGVWLFLLGNGSLWLFGTIWGRNQVIHNDCWWMRRKGETIILPDAKPAEQPITDNDFDNLLKSFDADETTARQKALNAFRTGTPEMRKKAVLILSQLGEVEKF